MRLRRSLYILLGLFMLMNLYSVLSLWFNLGLPALMTPFTTLTGMAFAALHAGQRLGWKRMLVLLALSFGVSLGYESLGVATGLVYGPYHYTDVLGVKFLGLVPLLIPVAWFMMMYPSFVIASGVAGGGRGWRRILSIAAVGGIVMTAWDVVMDPMMVSGGHWVWEVSGAYFGVPLQNYWGWWLTVFTVFALFLWWAGDEGAETGLDHLAVASYAITGLSTVLVSLDPDAGLAGPALAGIFALLPWIWVGWSRSRAR